MHEFEASTLLTDSESINYMVRFKYESVLLVGIGVLVVEVREKKLKTLHRLFCSSTSTLS